MRKPICHSLYLLILAITISGCNVYKFAYNNLSERIAYGKIDETFDIQGSQRQFVKTNLSETHLWHRRQALPRYARLLEEFSTKAKDGLTDDEVRQMVEEIRHEWRSILVKIAPSVGQFLTTLSDRQMAHAETVMHKSAQRRFDKLNLPLEEYVRERLKIARKWMKMFLGSASERQLEEVRKFIAENRPGEKSRFDQAAKNRTEFFELLRTKPSRETLTHVATNWLADQVIYENSDFQEAEARRQLNFIKLLVTIEQLNTNEQRAYFLKKMQELHSVVIELYAE